MDAGETEALSLGLLFSGEAGSFFDETFIAMIRSERKNGRSCKACLLWQEMAAILEDVRI
jgi:hypothetical protein